MGNIKITYTIPYGSALRIGYKAAGSSSAYTYLTTFPDAADSPYQFTVPAGFYDVEISTICPNCSGNRYSDPYVTQVTVPT